MKSTDDDPTIYTCSAGNDCRTPHNANLKSKWTGWTGTAAMFGFRRDGRRNTRCPTCRAGVASAGGRRQSQLASVRDEAPPRDMKALRVIERWCGMSYKATRGWSTPEAVKWQWEFRDADGKRGVSLQDVWTQRMRRLAGRADRCELARERVKARRLLGVAA